MRNLKNDELKAVSGGAAPKRNPAKAPGESYQGPAGADYPHNLLRSALS